MRICDVCKNDVGDKLHSMINECCANDDTKEVCDNCWDALQTIKKRNKETYNNIARKQIQSEWQEVIKERGDKGRSNNQDALRIDWLIQNCADIDAPEPGESSTWVIYTPGNDLGGGNGCHRSLRRAIDIAMTQKGQDAGQK